MLNVAPSGRSGFNDRLGRAVDGALKEKREEEPPRQYLGGSALGYECRRKLAYGYFKAPMDEGAGFKGKTYRIFDMGHDGEDRVAEYLRVVGFDIMTETAHGKQFGFAAFEERIKGHCDGVIIGATDELLAALPPLAFPALWENKCLNNTRFNAVKKSGVRKAEPEYYIQVQIYMNRIDVLKNADGTVNPTLWTAMNRNTGEIYYEMVPFEPRAAEDALLKGRQIIEAEAPEDLPRVAANSSDFRCKWCDYRERCWAEPTPPAPGAPQTGGFISTAAQPAAPAKKFPWQFGG